MEKIKFFGLELCQTGLRFTSLILTQKGRSHYGISSYETGTSEATIAVNNIILYIIAFIMFIWDEHKNIVDMIKISLRVT